VTHLIVRADHGIRVILRLMGGKPDITRRSIGEWAAAGEPAQLLAASRRYQWLERRLRERLPPELADHCQVARIRARQLVLLADDPAWHTRLRLQAEQVREIANDLLTEPVDAVVIRTRPPGPGRGGQGQRKRCKLSEHARHCLENTAETVSDPELSSILRRLATKHQS